FEMMPPFYREMANIIAGVDRIRISLSRLGWASKQIRQITKEHLAKIKRSRGLDTTPIRKSAFGRFSSVMRSIEKDLLFLNETRNLLRKMPTIDPAVPTILIAGYPNVGKSSFIVRITGARPEIAGEQRYQVVDTPGLLDRPMEERNDIERQSVAVLSHLQGVVIYIIDPSEHCGYPLESQLSLAEDLKKWIKLPMLIAANKADILRFGEDRDVLEMSTETGQGVENVLERLVCMLSERSSDEGENLSD
ncbi:MAG: 50S ribosome-binding GTPase, partial [Methanothrix sp.]|nr:50S ribosome-binding GTPase [Methanothrix sp.]